MRVDVSLHRHLAREAVLMTLICFPCTSGHTNAGFLIASTRRRFAYLFVLPMNLCILAKQNQPVGHSLFGAYIPTHLANLHRIHMQMHFVGFFSKGFLPWKLDVFCFAFFVFFFFLDHFLPVPSFLRIYPEYPEFVGNASAVSQTSDEVVWLLSAKEGRISWGKPVARKAPKNRNYGAVVGRRKLSNFRMTSSLHGNALWWSVVRRNTKEKCRGATPEHTWRLRNQSLFTNSWFEIVPCGAVKSNPDQFHPLQVPRHQLECGRIEEYPWPTEPGRF